MVDTKPILVVGSSHLSYISLTPTLDVLCQTYQEIELLTHKLENLLVVEVQMVEDMQNIPKIVSNGTLEQANGRSLTL